MQPDCMWNYSFCEWIDLEVEIDDDWYKVGNIEYDALHDLRKLVPTDGWDKIAQEPTVHEPCEATDLR